MIAEHERGASTAEGSEDAFARFLQRHANFVFSIAKRRLGNSSLAEDVTQAVFVRISQAPLPVKDDASVVAWLHRVTVNASIDAWRAECRRREREKAALLMQTESPCHSGDDAEIAERLDEALNELRETDRQAILLRYFKGHTMAEVGRLLGTGENAAKMRVHRALDLLREKLRARGVTCASGVLLTYLMDRAIEAAPTHLTSSLFGIKACAGWSGSSPTAGLSIGFKIAVTALMALVGVVALNLLPWSKILPSNVASTTDAVSASAANSVGLQTSATAATPVQTAAAPLTVTVRDSRTGAAIAGAQIRASFFYAGAVARELAVTDQQGAAELPRPKEPHRGVINLFVTTSNYVPMCFRWDTKADSHLEAMLKTARTVSGIIYDEQGTPVSDASIQLRGPSMDDPKQNPSFHHLDAIVSSYTDGRYVLPYLPEDWTTLEIRITKPDYTMTDVDIPLTNQDLSQVDLVLKSGVVLSGSVMTADGFPILGATIRELSNFGIEPPHTETDAAGQFMLRGVWNHYADRPFEVIVQAENFRPEIRAIELFSPTNWAHFKLSKGVLFKGRVHDEAGVPILGAAIGTSAYPVSEGLDRYRWETYTDAQGMFQWTSAPAVETRFYFEAVGFVTKHQVITPNDEMHDIELVRAEDQPR